MGEPKFRAWDKSLKRYFYDVAVYPNNIVAIQRHNIESMMLEAEYGATHWTELGENAVIEQYTGLKDKNGKEICDGDIVSVIGIGIAQVIDSPSGEWMLYYKREPDEIENGFACVVPKNKPSGLWKANITSYIEVIGNIHENPELLGEEE